MNTFAKTIHTYLVSPQNIFLKVLEIIKIFFFDKDEMDFVFFLVRSDLQHGTPPQILFLPSLFIIFEE